MSLAQSFSSSCAGSEKETPSRSFSRCSAKKCGWDSGSSVFDWQATWKIQFSLTSLESHLNSVDRHLLVVADPWCSRGKRSQRLINSLTINHIPDHANLVRFNQAVREQMSQHKHCYINPVFNLTSKKNSMVRGVFVNSMTNLIGLFNLQGLGLFGIQAISSIGRTRSSEPFSE